MREALRGWGRAAFEPVWLGFGCDVSLIFLRGGKAGWDPHLTRPTSTQLFALQAEIHRLKKEEQQPEEEEALVQHRLPSYVSNMDRLGDSELWVCAAPTLRLCPLCSPLLPAMNVELPGASPVLTVLVWAFWVRFPGPLVVPYLPASRPALPGACTSRRVQPGLIITAAFVKPWEVSVPWKERLLDDTIANHRLDTFLRRSMLLSQGLER